VILSCGALLDAALEAVTAEGRGIVLYMRGHEGRGIGLLHELQAYQLQEAGADIVDANLAMGLPADVRDYGIGAQILADLGVRSIAAAHQQPRQARRARGLRPHEISIALPVDWFPNTSTLPAFAVGETFNEARPPTRLESD